MSGRRMSAVHKRRCQSCDKTFSKTEHLTRHLRSHTKQRPYTCSICGKLYSRSDVLRRHEKSHQNASILTPEQPERDTTMLTPLSHGTQNPQPFITDNVNLLGQSTSVGGNEPQSISAQPFDDPIPNIDSSSWFLGTDLDVDALDFTLSSAVSEWAQLPRLPTSSTGDTCSFYTPNPTIPTGMINTTAREPLSDLVRQKWFTRLTAEEGALTGQSAFTPGGNPLAQGNFAADENYRAGLSQRLKPHTHDEVLPPSDQLNLFANLFFSRFNSLLPIIHLPSFRPTMEKSLLFISICSIGSLFVGSATAVAQGNRLFERLNKAILASWEAMLSNSPSDALSMVQAAVLGQTFAILSGRPKSLVLADVLHGTVMAWARESAKTAPPVPCDPQTLDPTSPDLDEQWTRWIDHEQRRRVEIAFNIHDAELAGLLHHEPLCKHRFSQYPRVASDELFMASTASRWAELYKKTPTEYLLFVIPEDPLQTAVAYSRFSAYGALESINAHIIEARRSNTFDEHESRRLSNMLMRWWSIYTNHFPSDRDEDPFSLTVLWHCVFIGIYVDIDLLEQAIGRDGQEATNSRAPLIRSWATSVDASKCLVHALLIQQSVERMRVSSEPAIHVPRALFSAALAWFCFTRVGGSHAIDVNAFDAPEIQLVGGFAGPHHSHSQSFSEAALTNISHLHRLIDLLNRLNRWGISQTFASVLCAALENKHRL